MANMFKHTSAASIPKFETDKDYQKWKSRRNAFVTVNAGGFSLPKFEQTFDDLYARPSGKPTANLDEVKVSVKGDYGLLRSVSVKFTCFDRGTFISAEKACLRPNRKISVNYGYVNPAYGGGGGSMGDLRVSGFNWTINNKNQYECSFTAIGPTSVLPEFNMRSQIKDTGLTFEQPRIIGPPKNVPVSGIPSLIEYDIQQGNGKPSDDVEDGTYISVGGGHIGVLDEPRTGLAGKLLAMLPDWLVPDPDKMTYISLGYLVTRVINGQMLSQATKAMKGRKMEIAASGKVLSGMISGDPMRVMFLGGVAGDFSDPSDPELGKNFDPNGTGPVAYAGRLNAANILFNKDFIVEAFEKAKVKQDTKKTGEKTSGGKKGTSGVNLQNFMDALFDKIHAASGGWFQFGLSESPDNTKILQIINKNEGAGGISPLTFDPINGDAVTRSTSISCSPAASDVYQAMCNQQKEAATPAEIEGSGDGGEGGIGAFLDYIKLRGLLTKHRTETAPGGFTDDLVTELESALATLVDTQPKAELIAESNIPFPMKLSITLDGTSGFRFGDIVSSTAIPSGITSANVVFRVTEVHHTIAKNDWSTSLETICDIG